MRYILLLSTDLNRSVDLFHKSDLTLNLEAAEVVSKCITTEYNPYEWDSSARVDMSLWTGHELQLFLYAYRMAQALGDTERTEMFDDLINAYNIDENSAMGRPAWTFSQDVIRSHVGYLKYLTQHRDHYGNLMLGVMPSPLPVPLSLDMLFLTRDRV